MNVHIVRIDGVNHGVFTRRNDLKRSIYTICAIRLADHDYIHRPGGYPHTTMDCPIDIAAVNGLADITDND